MSPVVAAERLTKRYRAHLAVQDVSFDVAAGEVLGLLGPNGSGKSTILRILTGYLHPTAGRARVAGYDIATEGLEARRRVGYVPEDVPLYTHMWVDEFLNFMGRMKGLSGVMLKSAIDSACRKLALDPVRSLGIGKLSRGYRQRVAIAQALLGDPELLVLDEPTNGLDPRQIIEMRGLIRGLAQAHTILVTSHILTEIEHVATRVAILLNGRLLTTRTLYDPSEGARMQIELLAPDADQVAELARAVPGVRHATATTDSSSGRIDLRVELAQPESSAALAAALVGRGWQLLRMQPLKQDLEALFLELTAATAPLEAKA
jgi:ABC-2 type transport system ATP-binding protein